MELQTYFVIFLLVYYNYYIFEMITNRKKRNVEQTKNTNLEYLRAKPAKTLEEQKQFLDLKFKKKTGEKKKFKFHMRWLTLKNIWIFIWTAALYMSFYKFYEYWFIKYNIEFTMVQAILFVIIFPLILNIFLNKFNLSKSDIGVFLRGSKLKNKKTECK